MEGPSVEREEVMATGHREITEHLVLIKMRKISQAKSQRPPIEEILCLCGHSEQQESAL